MATTPQRRVSEVDKRTRIADLASSSGRANGKSSENRTSPAGVPWKSGRVAQPKRSRVVTKQHGGDIRLVAAYGPN